MFESVCTMLAIILASCIAANAAVAHVERDGGPLPVGIKKRPSTQIITRHAE